MRELVYYIAVSIDGYIAGPGDEIDFYPSSDEYMAHMLAEYPDTIPSHIRSQVGLADAPLKTFDTVVMGRRTYEPAIAEGITSPYSHLRQVVVSRSIQQLDPAVAVVSQDPVRAIRSLKSEDSPLDIYLAGGGELAGVLLPEIDRIIVKQYPVVAGAGRSAFSGAFAPTLFELEDLRRFDGGNAIMTYTRRPAEKGQA
ncbi:dihydrofolate reductase family protein [Arthrobacter rhombi]|uniref:dihydrofolate reductase family protein n=1 Tax=Arthrobacter rhombi TaxID=71253 RepID=UPI0031D9EF27